MQIRRTIAARFLEGCPCVIEVGGYRNPITQFLPRTVDEIVVVDPLIEPYEAKELNGRPGLVRHLSMDVNDFDPEPFLDKRFGLVFLGMGIDESEKSELQIVSTLSRFVRLISHAQVAVLEYPVIWKPSSKLFDLILAVLQPRIACDIRLDLSSYGDGFPEEDQVRRLLVRRCAVLRDMQKPASEEALCRQVARMVAGRD